MTDWKIDTKAVRSLALCFFYSFFSIKVFMDQDKIRVCKEVGKKKKSANNQPTWSN